MIKRFCDLCGKPAAVISPIEVSREVAEKRSEEEGDRVRAVVLFRFASNGRSPDLCESCVLGMVADLKKEAERAKPASKE